MAAWLVAFLVRGSVGSSYNLGSPHGVALKDLADQIAKAFPEPRRVQVNAAAPQGKQSRWIPDIRSATDLGLKVQVDLPTAIERTLRWHYKHPNAAQHARALTEIESGGDAT